MTQPSTFCLKCYMDVAEGIEEEEEDFKCVCKERGVGFLIFRPDADSLPPEAGLGQFSIIDSLPENYLMLGSKRASFWKLEDNGICSYHYSYDE